VNARSVNVFGAVEYWLSAIKVTAIVIFICSRLYRLRAPSGSTAARAVGFQQLHRPRRFLAQGVWGRVGRGDRRDIQLPAASPAATKRSSRC